jgi:hypothetical protein
VTDAGLARWKKRPKALSAVLQLLAALARLLLTAAERDAQAVLGTLP